MYSITGFYEQKTGNGAKRDLFTWPLFSEIQGGHKSLPEEKTSPWNIHKVCLYLSTLAMNLALFFIRERDSNVLVENAVEWLFLNPRHFGSASSDPLNSQKTQPPWT